MIPNRLAFAAFGVACVAAAGAGSYLATRHNLAEQQVVSAATDTAVEPARGTASSTGEVASATEPAAKAPEQATADARPSAQPAKSAPSRSTPARSDARVRPATAAEPSSAPAVQTAPSSPLPSATVATEPAPLVARDERPLDQPTTPETPKPTLEELTVAADSVIGLQTENTLSSERARIEDRVEARVVRDVRVNGRVAIPAGSRAYGSVVVVERGGRARTRARLGIRFHTLALADGTRLPITTETIFRYGDDPSNGSAAKIGGGAVAGAILGAIIGGGKGAAIGATTGAAGGGAMVMAGDRSEAIFPSGAQVTARIVSPVTITVDK
ncbi:MAG: hypothetical protein JSU08_05975 [Acidobacteria bacterium]|nr:hypothetical protein [Acidobacteriota bacterium]